MSWYDTNYKYRVAVRIPVSVVAGGASTANENIEFTVPSDYPFFWDNIRSDALDVLPVNANDNVLTTFRRSSFNYGNRLLTIQIQNLTRENVESVKMIWLYFGNAATSVDQSGTVTAGSFTTGVIYKGKAGPIIIQPDTQYSNATDTPSTTVTKRTDEAIYYWFEYQSLMLTRGTPYQGKIELEDINYIVPFVVNSSGANQPSNYDRLDTIFANGCIGFKTKANHIASEDGKDYLFGFTIHTSLQNTYVVKAMISLRNKLPA